MHHLLHKTLNARLSRIEICKRIGVPPWYSLSNKLRVIRYLAAEFWSEEETKEMVFLIAGVYLANKFYADVVE